MSNDAKTTLSDVNEPLLENSQKKNGPQPENLPKSDYAPNKDTTNIKRNKSVAIIEQKKNAKDMEKWKMVPPDGGWGWLVLIGATLVNVLVPGTVKSFGVLFVEFLEAFDASPAAGMWIPALCYFLYSSLGPLSSILSVKYSYRMVTLVGGTFAAVGMMLSFFAKSVAYLYVTYGILVGIGAGLSFPPTVYIVTSYFVRLRGVANGVCISGSALGSIILPPVLRILLDIYGYRGAVLLMGGVTLNVWVAALFYDPVEKHLKRVPIEETSDETKDSEEDSLKPQFIISAGSMTSIPPIPHNDSFLENIDASGCNFNRSASSAAFQNLKGQHRERKISMPTGRNEVMRVKSGYGSKNNMNSSSALHAVPENKNGMAAMDVYSQSKLPSSRRPRSGLPKRSPSTSSFQYVSTPYHGSTLTLQPETFASSFSLRSSSRPGKKGEKEEPVKRNRFFDVSLLKDPLYLIILISNATNAISYTNFIILLPSYAQSLEFDKNSGALLLSVVSALDLVGRIGGSALSDLQLCPKAWYFIGGLFISGISLAMMPLFIDYSLICVFCAIFGLASGIYVGVTAVIMADLLGEERLQSTYGISLFVNGILQLIGPPLCGLWFEETKSFTSLFTTLGIVLVSGSVIWGFVPCIKKKKATTDENTIQEETP